MAHLSVWWSPRDQGSIEVSLLVTCSVPACDAIASEYNATEDRLQVAREKVAAAEMQALESSFSSKNISGGSVSAKMKVEVYAVACAQNGEDSHFHNPLYGRNLDRVMSVIATHDNSINNFEPHEWDDEFLSRSGRSCEEVYTIKVFTF